MRDNGAIEGASDGFAEEDEVMVLINSDKSVIKVIGHIDGVQPCSLYIVEFLYHEIGGSRYWAAKGDECYEILDEDEIGRANEMSYHLYAGEWLHEANAINWKDVIETGETDPETGEPITRPITYKDKRPETSMEWVSGNSYGTPPPNGIVMPQYKRSLLDAWGIFVDWDMTPRNISGMTPDEMATANREESSGHLLTSGSGSYSDTYSDYTYLKGMNEGGEIQWPNFDSGDYAFHQNYEFDYDWEGDPGGGYMSDSASSHSSASYEYTYNYIACGDGKVFGCNKKQTITSSASSSLYIATAARHVIHASNSNSSEGISLSAFMYGNRVLRPAAEYNYTYSYNVSLNAIGGDGVPATGSSTTTESGKDYAPYVAIGCGDDEFVCLYEIIDYDNNKTGTYTSADLSWSIWAPYAEWPWRYSLPSYHGNTSQSYETKEYWVAFRTIAGAEYLQDVTEDDFIIKDGITHIRVAKCDVNVANYESAWIYGCECGDYFFIQIMRYQINPYPSAEWVFYTSFLSINKKTGAHYLTDVESAYASEHKGLSIYVKGIGKDVYKEPEPEPEL